MSMLIREADEHDLQGVLRLYAQPDFDDGKVLELDEARRLLAVFRSYPNYRLFVACDDDGKGEVVGTYALLVMHNLAHHGTPSAIIEDIAVCPQRHGQGIGRRLMAHALAQAQHAGCYKLALSANLKRPKAHAFYHALEFKRHGISFAIET